MKSILLLGWLGFASGLAFLFDESIRGPMFILGLLIPIIILIQMKKYNLIYFYPKSGTFCKYCGGYEVLTPSHLFNTTTGKRDGVLFIECLRCGSGGDMPS